MVVVRADGVTITGFAIENSGASAAYNVINVLDHDDCLISDNDISYFTMMGIACANSSHNRIVGNTISYSDWRHGIGLFRANNNTVTDNVITDMKNEGITVWSSHYNTITGNHISGCERYGIDLIGDYNLVRRNHFEGNHAGVHINGGAHNTIKQNNFIDNDIQAFFLHSFPPYEQPPPYFNRWLQNYWDDWKGIGPKVIHGYPVFYPVD